jgi:uncharacterized GH25 family protein
MMKILFALAALLIASSSADAHGVPVIRSQVVVPYQPVLQVQAVYAAPVVQVQAYAAPLAVSSCYSQAFAVQQVQQVYAQPVLQVRQQVIRQNVIQVRQPQVFQRSVTRTRTVIR